MAEFTHIEWFHHTFNGWRGCTKCSAGCKNCYADKLSERNPAVLGIWGPNGSRVVAVDSYWRQPLKWDRDAKAAAERRRVFSASLSDVLEGPESMPAEDHPRIVQARGRLLELMARTPNLDWLWLTKRPEGWSDRLHEVVQQYAGGDFELTHGIPTGDVIASAWLDGEPPANLWMGTSVEDEEAANERIPHLLDIPARIRFLSVEPLIGPVRLPFHEEIPEWQRAGVMEAIEAMGGIPDNSLNAQWSRYLDRAEKGIHWVIVGGESGPRARPMHPDWARSIRDQCEAAGVPFLFKQWGDWLPFHNAEDLPKGFDSSPVCLVKPDGRVIRPYSYEDRPGQQMVRVGKKAAGRTLDSFIHDGYPAPEAVAR